MAGQLKQRLRYGENPHQQAALYVGGAPRPGVASAEQIQGKELSYNNLNDTDAAFEAVAEFEPPAVAIIKHANPCGVAVGASPRARPTTRRWPAIPSAPMAASSPSTGRSTGRRRSASAKLFAEVVIAPAIEPAARAVLARQESAAAPHHRRHAGSGGVRRDPALARRRISPADPRQWPGRASADLKTVTRRAPTPAELDDLLFAFRVAKHVKSNAIVYAKAVPPWASAPGR